MTTNNKYYNLVPGYLQGLTRVFISYPFDYVRLYRQTNKDINIKSEIKTLGLYRGIMLPLIINPIDRAVSFYVYEYLKSNNYSKVEVALYPTIISSLYMTPINIINSNYIYNKSTYKNLINKEIKKNFYRGNGIEIFRNGISSFLFLYMYNLNLIKDIPFMNGVLSSCLMWSIVYPLDTIKAQKFINSRGYLDIIKNTQIPHLYRGISLVYLKSVPSAGIGMYVYEKSKQFLTVYKKY
jgi:hypothetical protein